MSRTALLRHLPIPLRTRLVLRAIPFGSASIRQVSQISPNTPDLLIDDREIARRPRSSAHLKENEYASTYDIADEELPSVAAESGESTTIRENIT